MLKKYFERIIPASLEPITSSSGILEKQYKDRVAKRHIQHDEAQLEALRRLQSLLDHLPIILKHNQKSAVHKFLSKPPEKCRSLYIFGDVGRGKSMLMALFYDACPLQEKRRVHFNTFMQEVHAFMHQCRQRNEADAISALAKQIRASVILLCFDEFHVTDIADAMILGRLFSKLFELGVIVVITSNRHPSDLYQGGLQREQFLFFIKVLQGEAQIIELDAKEDYRLSYQAARQKNYYWPIDDNARAFIRRRYNELTQLTVMHVGVLRVFGREIVLFAAHGDVAYTSFNELCAQSLGPADYLAIAKKFKTLIVADIPKLTIEKRNEAKRLVTLIDALYEHKVQLICSAEVPPQELYTEGDGAFEFRRTVSRLIEMQSEAYLRGR